MTILDKDKDALIEYRLKQAFEASEAAKTLISLKHSAAALNRIYYAAFYSLLALALFKGFKTSKHLQLIGWFNRNFISTGLIDKNFGRILRDCYNFRISADYDSFVVFENVDIELLFSEMTSFISRIERFIKE